MGKYTERRPDNIAPQILLVDDEEDILPEYEEFLDLQGYPAGVCSDPELAFAMVLDQPEIALVITDLRMAGLDGASLIRKLSASLPPERRLEFIILTGDATSQLGEDIAHVPVFIKPADTDALLAAIGSALDRAR